MGCSIDVERTEGRSHHSPTSTGVAHSSETRECLGRILASSSTRTGSLVVDTSKPYAPHSLSQCYRLLASPPLPAQHTPARASALFGD
jgi:hypothetical protein